jgi:two-component system response regulator RegA
VLTGFGSIATAVEAVRRGATHYLTKPADADEILAALTPRRASGRLRFPCSRCRSTASNGSTSTACWPIATATSRRPPASSALHRRSLQRKLSK